MSNRTHQKSHGRRRVFQELNAQGQTISINIRDGRSDEERFDASQIQLCAEANLELVS